LNEQINFYINKIKNNDEISIESKDYTCKYCKSTFTTKGNIKKHVNKNCSIRNEISTKLNCLEDELVIAKNNINEIEGITLDSEVSDEDSCDDCNNKDDITYNNLTKEALIEIVKKSKKKIKNLKTKQIINNTTNNINNINNINNQQINNINNINNIQINLTNFDNPNCEFLTLDQKNKFLKDRYKGLIDFITFVYFNESYPENHTILYTNLRSKFGQIYKNNKWMIEEIDLIADKLNKQSFDKLSKHLDEIKNNNKYAEIYKKDIVKGLNFVDHFVSNDTSKQSKSDIKKTLYNNKEIVTNTKKHFIKID
jgi:hypothetical protein